MKNYIYIVYTYITTSLNGNEGRKLSKIFYDIHFSKHLDLGRRQRRVPGVHQLVRIQLHVPSAEDGEEFLRDNRSKMWVLLNSFDLFLMPSTNTYKNIHSRYMYILYFSWCMIVFHTPMLPVSIYPFQIDRSAKVFGSLENFNITLFWNKKGCNLSNSSLARTTTPMLRRKRIESRPRQLMCIGVGKLRFEWQHEEEWMLLPFLLLL